MDSNGKRSDEEFFHDDDGDNDDESDEMKSLADESVLSVDQDVDRPSQEEGKT